MAAQAPQETGGSTIGFAPMVDLVTGGVVAIEASAHGSLSTLDPAEADVWLAQAAARAAAENEALLPLLLSLRPSTIAHGSAAITRLLRDLRLMGRRPREVILCVEGHVAPSATRALISGAAGLRAGGYRIALGGIGASHTPLDLMTELAPYMIRLAPALACALPTDGRRAAVIEALAGLSRRIDALVVATGVQTEAQIGALRRLGVRLAQGSAFAPPQWRPATRVTVPLPHASGGSESDAPPPPATMGPRVTEFCVPAVMLPVTATADDVRSVLTAEPSTTSVVLVDDEQRPCHTIDRTRFLLTVTGPYGHALHAKRPASRLADPPRLVPMSVPAFVALRIAGQESERVYDDLVVVDAMSRCLGVVRVGDLIRALSESGAV